MALLEVENLSTHFFTESGTVHAVDRITFELEEGETLALVGESGSGKSVSALSIMRLVPDPPGRIVGGKILFQGRNLLELSARDMRRVRGRHISMVFQEPTTFLNPVLTIGRQITEGMELHLGMDRSQAFHRGVELLELVGIPDPESRFYDYPHQFSGGQRQRVMIAAALSCQPKLLIADEPTTALDVTIQAQILDLIKNLTAQLGTAVILITHNLGIVARYADRVSVMYAGEIVESADAREIYRHPRHPYTLGLLASVPRLDRAPDGPLPTIEGQPPVLEGQKVGCIFRSRCPYVIDRCSFERPVFQRISLRHVSACWEANKLAQIQESAVAP